MENVLTTRFSEAKSMKFTRRVRRDVVVRFEKFKNTVEKARMSTEKGFISRESNRLVEKNTNGIVDIVKFRVKRDSDANEDKNPLALETVSVDRFSI